jgi:subtilisin family serine protease
MRANGKFYKFVLRCTLALTTCGIVQFPLAAQISLIRTQEQANGGPKARFHGRSIAELVSNYNSPNAQPAANSSQIIRTQEQANGGPKARLHGRSIAELVSNYSSPNAQLAANSSQSSNPEPEYVPDTVLVAFQPRVPESQKDMIVKQVSPNLEIDASPQPSPFFSRLHISGLGASQNMTVENTIALLKQDPRIRVAEPDYIVHTTATVPNDPNFNLLWGLQNTGQSPFYGVSGADISATKAWDLTRGSANVVVAVIDTGVDYTHPDLSSNILRDSSNNVVGYNFVSNNNNPMDDYGHGTHCAGIIGAVGNNGVGVVGVNWTVKIMPVKFLDSTGSGYTSDAVLSVDYAVSHGAQVLSNSWGGAGYSQLLLEAIQRAERAGVLFVAAAGNSSDDIDLGGFFPAGYNTYVSNVVAVAATDYDDQLAYFSNYGPKTCDIAAPGEEIYSTVPTGSCALCASSGYTYLSGTSMATPYVAGAVALLKSSFPSATASDLKYRILFNADQPSALAGMIRYGRLNVFAAFKNDTINPGIPKNFTISKASTTSFMLAWTDSGQDGTSGTVSDYEVVYSTSPTFSSAITLDTKMSPGPPGTSESYLLSNLSPQTTYYVGLRAIDSVGNKSPRATVSSTTNAPYFFDGAESTPKFSVAEGTFGITTAASHTGTHSYNDGSAGAGGYNYLGLTNSMTMTITGGSKLYFWAKTDLDANNGFAECYAYSTTGSLFAYTFMTYGSSDWTEYVLDLSQFSGIPFYIYFLDYNAIGTDGVKHTGLYVDDISITQLTRIYLDNVEGTAQFTGWGPWAITTETSESPTHSWSDSPNSTFGNNVVLPLMQNSSVSTGGYDSLSLVFGATTALFYGRDYLTMYASQDNGVNWDVVGNLTGTYPSWTKFGYGLADYPQVRILFVLTTGAGIRLDGVHLDDIELWGDPFTNATAVPVPNYAIWDVNADGKQDILWRNSSTGDIYTWTMNGITEIGGVDMGIVSDQTWQIVGKADFNGDGQADLLWRNNVSGQNYVWFMNGAALTVGSFIDSVSDLNWQIVGVGDFNGDGNPDILWRNKATGQNYVWYMNGTTHTGGAYLSTVSDLNWKIVAVGDFNGDGMPDILWRNVSTGENYVWYMNGIVYTGGADLQPVTDQNWKICDVGDFNQDGNLDILWRNYSTGQNYVWFMNGATEISGGYLLAVTDLTWKIMPQVY